MNLTDTSELATELEMAMTEDAIRAASLKAEAIKPTYFCINRDCEEKSMSGGRFCSIDCRDEYDKLLKRGLIREKI